MSKGLQAEILAPAGSPDSLIAALEHGADAVYLGLKDFNARGNAVNFSAEELAHYVPLAHRRGTKVYLTLNTIVKMEERTPILESLSKASDCGIDGVILQDLGLADILATHFPHLRRHASTQLAVHNKEGVAFCVERGFHRVVLARELTIDEIREIRIAFPKETIELEVFCHGAMCYTYSGMCFFSGSVGGRSGNRGECAYTCRKGYRIHNETAFPMAAEPGSFRNYLFSMKDMNTLEVLPELLAGGVDSLKIEGRRKGPAYVGSSVEAYRERMAESLNPNRERDMKLAFARDFTKAFYQRGQFGDAPIDLTATGTQGIPIGIIEADGRFKLKEAGIQRFDGIRFVLPDRSESSTSFNGYTVSEGDPHQPQVGVYIKPQADLPTGTKVYWVRSQDVEKRYKPDKDNRYHGEKQTAIPVDLAIQIEDGQLQAVYTCAYGSASGTLPCEPSKSGKQLDIKGLLFRFGDMDFREGAYHGPMSAPLFVPLSQVKKLRRDLLTQLEDQVQGKRPKAVAQITAVANAPLIENLSSVVSPRYILRYDKPEHTQAVMHMAEAGDYDIDFTMRPTISTPQWKAAIDQLVRFPRRVRLVFPMVLRKWDTRVIRHRLAYLKEKEQHFDWVFSNPGHGDLAAEVPAVQTRHADFSLYHINSWACRALRGAGINGRFTLSLEDDRKNIESLLEHVEPAAFEVIAYTDTPLFIAEACSLAALYGGCPGAKVCRHETLHIENEHGDHFQVRHDRCRSTVIGENALSWSGHLEWFKKRGVGHFRADFTVRDYQPEHIEEIMARIKTDSAITGTHTENLNRTLL